MKNVIPEVAEFLGDHWRGGELTLERLHLQLADLDEGLSRARELGLPDTERQLAALHRGLTRRIAAIQNAA